MTGLHQIRYNGDICPSQSDTLLERAGAMTHLQAAIPEEADKVLDLTDLVAGGVSREQNQEINIRARMLFLASVTSNGNERQLILSDAIINQSAPKVQKEAVDELTICPEEGVWSNLCGVCSGQSLPGLLQLGFA